MATPALLDLSATSAPAGVPSRPSPVGRPRLVVLEGGRGRTGPVSSPLCRPVRHPAALVRRRRLVLLITVAALAFLAASWFDDGASVPTQAEVSSLTVDDDAVYVVQPGDTLWSIARRLGSNGDVRATVDALIDRHGSASVSVGDRLPLTGLAPDP